MVGYSFEINLLSTFSFIQMFSSWPMSLPNLVVDEGFGIFI